uniref:Uncharacterized protein n=1 Tax=Rhizophora mucronata TaxID=61149 RepID=A0A2P2N993_RHIMU
MHSLFSVKHIRSQYISLEHSILFRCPYPDITQGLQSWQSCIKL